MEQTPSRRFIPARALLISGVRRQIPVKIIKCPKIAVVFVVISIILFFFVMFCPIAIVVLTNSFMWIESTWNQLKSNDLISSILIFLFVPLVLLPCFSSAKNIWLFPLFASIITAAGLIYMIIRNITSVKMWTIFAWLPTIILVITTGCEAFLVRKHSHRRYN